PALHTAAISSTMLHELGDVVSIGPILMGLKKPVQIVTMGANVNDLLTSAAMAAIDAIENKQEASKL
ncbi:MAG: hypothetical protein FJX23_10335, partial [Alphaproteobacteria bacterium]|nr:hypothetical protein [Alphaproteobacteria bacterium]